MSSMMLPTIGWAGSINLESFNHDHVEGELLVLWKDSTSNLNAQSAIETKVQEIGAQTVRTFRSEGAKQLRFTSKMSKVELLATAKQLAAREDVVYVEANNIIYLTATPNDPRLSSLWGFKNMRVSDAWVHATGAPDIVVGVIDTGVDYNHPDIAPNYWNNSGETGLDSEGRDKRTNRIDDDKNGYVDDWRGWDFAAGDNDPMDTHSHGTHCAGTIGARGDNGVGVVGVNWEVGIVGLKFMSGASGTTAAAIEAIEYATMMGISVTNNSWGGGGRSETLISAVRKAGEAGHVFVAAAGNDTRNNDSTPTWPANIDLDNVITVAATGSSDQIASFSNWGRRTVHVAAPGVGIISTTPRNSYGPMSGTSMAAPHVAGAVAMIRSQFPELTPKEVRDLLISTSDLVPALATRSQSGGRVNLERAIAPQAP
jgi:subtilisin family serine protease